MAVGTTAIFFWEIQDQLLAFHPTNGLSQLVNRLMQLVTIVPR